MRSSRFVLGVVAACALILTAGAAHAAWSDRAPVGAAPVVTGAFGATTSWVGGAPAWTTPFPGQQTDATLRVTGTSVGTTLRWSLGVTATVTAAFQPYTTVQAWVGACGTGSPLASVPSGSFTPTQVVDVCVRVSLAAGAPASLRGQSINPALTLTIAQRSTP
jgi:hypothetical protein